MGNWKNRPRRRFYRHDGAPRFPSSYHDPEPSLSEFSNDGVPLWEKKFCTIVGRVSWRKIVDAKNLLCYNDNVLNWDDSAGEEAFQNAKKQYQAEINGFSCDTSAPDPDAYIDEINWYPYIDPEMIRDLEQEYFAPNDGENEIERNLLSTLSEACNTNPSKVVNPWECNDSQGIDGLKDLMAWGKSASKVDNSKNLNSNGNNPWENGITRGDGSGKHNSWGDYGSKSRDWNTGNKSWGHSYQHIDSKKDDGWGDLKRNYWGSNRPDTNKLPNGENRWERSCRHNGVSNDKGCGNCGTNSWGWKQRESHNIGYRKLDFKKTSSSGGAWHTSSRKREGSHQYIHRYKSSRLQRDDNQANHYWRSGEPN